jgi:hypothetical protein
VKKKAKETFWQKKTKVFLAMAMGVAKSASRSWFRPLRVATFAVCLGGGLGMGMGMGMGYRAHAKSAISDSKALGLSDQDFRSLHNPINHDAGRDALERSLSAAVRGAPRSQLRMADNRHGKLVTTDEDEKEWWGVTQRWGMGQRWGMAQCIHSTGSNIQMSAATGLFSCTVPKTSQSWNVIVPAAEIEQVLNAVSVVVTG